VVHDRREPGIGGQTQLRVRRSQSNCPFGDDLYPEIRERALDDYRAPLQLLAAELTFTDPLTDTPRRFTSRLRLAAWSALDDLLRNAKDA
jgi:tRNA pseudouridine32 synthase/23S rRNA pseudouridine746 synthase